MVETSFLTCLRMNLGVSSRDIIRNNDKKADVKSKSLSEGVHQKVVKPNGAKGRERSRERKNKVEE